MDASELREALRGVWESQVGYAEAVAPDDLEQILSDLHSGRPERAKEFLSQALERGFTAWSAACPADDADNRAQARL